MNPIKVLETERLYLRRMTVEDAENAYLLNLDPEVIQYTGDDSFESIEAARQFLTSYRHYDEYDFGRWAVIAKENDEFLGWCGLKFTPERNEYDIGFRFFKKHWNKGFATEAAQASINLGFNHYKLTTIVGRARKENIGSIRVLEKIGLTYVEDFDFDGNDGVIYRKNEF
jgi:ribosomal-protein-alanine N-acetyltransferase